MEITCPICGDTLANSPAGLTCLCGFTARNVYQAERVRAKITLAGRIAASRARIAKTHEEQGVSWHVTARADGSTNFGDVAPGTYALIPVKEDKP